MADTVETLRADLNKLRTDFDALKAASMPVIDAHKKELPEPLKSNLAKLQTFSGPLPPT